MELFAEGDEGSYLPNFQSNLVIARRRPDLAIFHHFGAIL